MLRPRQLASLILFVLIVALLTLPNRVAGRLQPSARAAATFTVNSTGDVGDNNWGDGVCDSGGGNCTLRAAIQQAQFLPGDDIINITATGTINLTHELPTLTTNMTINGPGSSLLTLRRDTGGDYRIFIIISTVNISGITLSNGQVNPGGGAGGGIATNINAVVTLTDVTVTGNRASDGTNGSSGGHSAGGIGNNGRLTLVNCTVSGNSSGTGINGSFGPGAGGRGAGIDNSTGGTVTIINSVITGNTTGGGPLGGGDGAGIFNGGTLFMTNSTISNNVTGGTGGAGGGLYAAGPTTLTNVTITGNQAASGHGVRNDFFGSVSMRNTLVARNGGAGAPDLFGSFTSLGHNLVGNGDGSSGFVNGANGDKVGTAGSPIDPLLNALGSYGGLTQTHALKPNSPALDAGDNALALDPNNGTLTTDQRGAGFARIAASAGSGTATVDIGAFEYQPSMEDVGNKTTPEDTELSFAFRIGDESASASTVVTASSDDQTLIPDSGLEVTGTGPARRLRITPAANLSGTANITLTATVTGGPSMSDTFQLTVTPVNDPPTAANDSLEVNEDSGATVVNVLGNDSAAPDTGETLTVTAVTQPANGSASLTGGVVRYTPASHFNGADAFTYTVSDGNGGSANASVSVTVNAVNDPPTANAQTVSTSEDTSKVITFTGSDVDGEAPTFTVVSGPSHGSLTGTGASRTYTPAADFNGADSLTFMALDAAGAESAPATVSINVTPVNDAPSFTKGADQTLAEDAGPQSVSGWATAVSPGPNESAQAVSFLVTNNTNAALFSSAPAVDPSGTLSFTAAANASGSATLTLVARDDGGTANGGQDTSAAQTFTITVTPVNDPPNAQDQSVTTPEDTARFISLAATDAEGNPLTYTVTSGPSHGTLTGTLSSRTYTPAAHYSGPDSFTFKVTDSAGADSAPATVSITVTPVNDAPVNTVPGPQATDQNATLVFSAANSNAVSVSDVDAGTDPLRVTLTASNGTLTLGGTTGLTFTAGDGTDDVTMTFASTQNNLNAALGGLAFKPNAGYSGAASLQINTSDQGFNGAGGARSDTDFVSITVRPGSIEFTQSSYSVNEGAGALAVTVRRTGDTSQSASVAYATEDGSNPGVSVPCSATSGAALDRCDFTRALGRLAFAPGETEKVVTVLVGDDSYVEGPETALIRLSSVSGSNVVLGTRTVATLEIADDPQESSANPIDETGRFVRQHYADFLNREPDAAGLAFWTNEIEGCGADAQCREVKRINVSAAFFLSIEFQQTGYLVYRLDKVAFGNLTGRPVPLTLTEFLSDTQGIGQGLVVGADGWEQKLEANKRAFADAFVLRTRFLSRYPTSTTPEQYIDSLNANAGGVLAQEERDALVLDLMNGAKTRAQVLRAVAEHAAVVRRESNQAFVLMQYFGYLRRNPDDAPEQNRDFAGYNFWLSKLNEFNGDFIQAEMVKAFLSAEEYRRRFGQ